jgi:DNA replication protein DnaC
MLADRARAAEWFYEQFAAALLETETDSRDSHGGQARIKHASFPTYKTLEEFDFAFQRSIKRTQFCTSASSTSRPAARTSSCSAQPGAGKTHLAVALAVRARWLATAFFSGRRPSGSPC